MLSSIFQKENEGRGEEREDETERSLLKLEAEADFPLWSESSRYGPRASYLGKLHLILLDLLTLPFGGFPRLIIFGNRVASIAH